MELELKRQSTSCQVCNVENQTGCVAGQRTSLSEVRSGCFDQRNVVGVVEQVGCAGQGTRVHHQSLSVARMRPVEGLSVARREMRRTIGAEAKI